MKIKKILSITIISIIVLTGISYGYELEDAITPKSDSSVYMVIGHEDIGGFLKWILSRDNLKIVGPAFDMDEGLIELVSLVVDNFPVQKAIMIFGAERAKKGINPIVQAAFTVKPGLSSIVNKIEVGSAEAKDIAKLLLGDNELLVSFLETMIKVERVPGKILKINNEVYMKAEDGIILISSEPQELMLSRNNLRDPKGNLVKKFGRKFSTNNYTLVNVDFQTLKLMEESDKDIAEAAKYFKAPLKMEMGFETYPDKFITGTNINLIDCLSEKYSSKVRKDIEAVKGGYISRVGIGGSSPLIALGSFIDISVMKEDESSKKFFKELCKSVNIFGITEDDLLSLVDGGFSLVLNGSIPLEGFKVPGLYISQTGKDGAADYIFNKLSDSKFFSAMGEKYKGNWENLLQLDSSISPASCFVGKKGNTLGLSFAELEELNKDGEGNYKKNFNNLLDKRSISSLWIDFKGIQDWLNDENNGVFGILTPLAVFSGYGEIMASFRELMNAELSVPSIALYCENTGTFYFEYELADINPENGVLKRAINLYQQYEQKSKKK